MKIVKGGKAIATLPDKPKNFDGWSKGGQITLQVGDDEIKIARYSSNERAGAVVKAMCQAYLSGADVFDLPKED